MQKEIAFRRTTQEKQSLKLLLLKKKLKSKIKRKELSKAQKLVSQQILKAES